MRNLEELEEILIDKDIDEDKVDSFIENLKNQNKNIDAEYLGEIQHFDQALKERTGDYGLVSYVQQKNHAPFFSSILSSGLFRPIKKGRERKDVFIELRKKLKNEMHLTCVIQGLECNIAFDFLVYGTILRLLDESGFHKLIISPENLAVGMGEIDKFNSAPSKYKSRLMDSLQTVAEVLVYFELKNETDGEICQTLAFNLIDSVNINPDEQLELAFTQDFFTAYEQSSLYLHRSIDLTYFRYMPNDTAKTLFLFYESLHDSSQEVCYRKVYRDDLIRVCNLESVTKDNNRTARLQKAHKELQDYGFLAAFDDKKIKHIRYYLVYINSKKSKRRFTKQKITKVEKQKAEKRNFPLEKN